MRSKVEVHVRITFVIQFGFGQVTVYIGRKITAEVLGVEQETVGASINSVVAVLTDDEGLTVVGVPSNVDLIRLALVVQFNFRFLEVQKLL